MSRFQCFDRGCPLNRTCTIMSLATGIVSSTVAETAKGDAANAGPRCCAGSTTARTLAAMLASASALGRPPFAIAASTSGGSVSASTSAFGGAMGGTYLGSVTSSAPVAPASYCARKALES